MCPLFDSSKSKCKVVPWDSSAYQDGSFKEYYCLDKDNCKKCGNYEKFQKGEYKIER